MVAFAEFDNRGVSLSRCAGIQNLRIQNRRLDHSAEADPDAVPTRGQVAKLESTVAIRFRRQSLGRRPKAIARNQLEQYARRWLAVGRERDTAESPVVPHEKGGGETRSRIPDLNRTVQILGAEDCRWNCL